MPKFALLFDLPDDEQVLVEVAINLEDKTFDMKVTTDFGNDGRAVVTFSYQKEIDALIGMANYTMEKAIQFRKLEENLFYSESQ